MRVKVSLSGIVYKTFKTKVPVKSIILTHYFGTFDIIVYVYDENDILITPLGIDYFSSDKIEVHFDHQFTGSIKVDKI